MKPEPEYLPKCNLRQAAEWIAFKFKPLPNTLKDHFGYNNIIERPDYNDRMDEAFLALHIALHDGTITATGENNDIRKPIPAKGQDIDILYDEQDGFDIFPRPCILINPSEKMEVFEHVEFDTESLITAFPVTKATSSLPYTTPYIDTIFEIIEQMQITYEKVPTAKDLYYAILENLEKKGIVAAERTAQEMAAIMRQPEGRRGRKPTKTAKKTTSTK